jgi:hypothetical protein
MMRPVVRVVTRSPVAPPTPIAPPLPQIEALIDERQSLSACSASAVARMKLLERMTQCELAHISRMLP